MVRWPWQRCELRAAIPAESTVGEEPGHGELHCGWCRCCMEEQVVVSQLNRAQSSAKPHYCYG